MTHTPGFVQFIAQIDNVGRSLLVILLVMSLLTWTLIASGSVARLIERRWRRRFLRAFWSADSLAAMKRGLEARSTKDAFSRLAAHAFAASRHHRHHGPEHPKLVGHGADFLTRSMRRAIGEETARLERGLTLLASIGSTAPFVGLFGTVWGVHHALVSIGLSGQGTLEQVAGPVGEALIMTALGLAVAIPAVLAYNGFVHANRVVLTELDGFAHDLFALLATGAPLAGDTTGADVVPIAASTRGLPGR